jgi:16S rRNA (guanine(966)-N(2))-methyltransferase RsmD
MRIIAGSRKGMKLLPPKGEGTRPITDRIKESLFNVLNNTYGLPEGSNAADIFCGTGSMGLEALSRGALNLNFVEKDPKVISILERNIEKAGFTEKSRTIRGNGFKTGAALRPSDKRCHLAFVDPPYAASKNCLENSRIAKLLLLLCDQMQQNGIVVVRTHEQNKLLQTYGQLQVVDVRNWGSMNITILKNNMDMKNEQ